MADRDNNTAVPENEVVKNDGGEAGKEPASFKDQIPDKDDLTGPAGDPAEGKRLGGSSYPA